MVAEHCQFKHQFGWVGGKFSSSVGLCLVNTLVPPRYAASMQQWPAVLLHSKNVENVRYVEIWLLYLTLWWHRLNLRHSPHSNKWHRTIAAYSSPLRWHRTTWYIHHPHGGIANLRHIHHSLNGIAPKAETLLTSLINLSRSVVASINPESLALARSNSSGCRPSHSSPKNFLAILQNF